MDSDLPDPSATPGERTGRQLIPEFKAWTETHNVDASTAIHSALNDLPGKVMLLGETGDPRGIPLLRRALQSHNYFIVIWVAKGLAQTQDKQSIPLIIAAVQRAPPEYDSLIAESLVYFDDAQAQSAVDSYIPKDKATLAGGESTRARSLRLVGYRIDGCPSEPGSVEIESDRQAVNITDRCLGPVPGWSGAGSGPKTMPGWFHPGHWIAVSTVIRKQAVLVYASSAKRTAFTRPGPFFGTVFFLVRGLMMLIAEASSCVFKYAA